MTRILTKKLAQTEDYSRSSKSSLLGNNQETRAGRGHASLALSKRKGEDHSTSRFPFLLAILDNVILILQTVFLRLSSG